MPVPGMASLRFEQQTYMCAATMNEFGRGQSQLANGQLGAETAMRPFDTVDSSRIERARKPKLPEHCGELRLVLGTCAPYRIEQVSADLMDLFQLSPAHCIGRTMAVISGPETNTRVLTDLIEAALE